MASSGRARTCGHSQIQPWLAETRLFYAQVFRVVTGFRLPRRQDSFPGISGV